MPSPRPRRLSKPRCPASGQPSRTAVPETVTISIRCDAVLDNYDDLWPELQSDEFVPPDGVILPETAYVLREGDTVFDILDRAARYNRIQMEYQGGDKNSFGSVYIQSIHYLYEFSCGPLSGWMWVPLITTATSRMTNSSASRSFFILVPSFVPIRGYACGS